MKWKKEQEALKLKQDRKKKMIAIAGIAGVLLSCFLVFTIVTKGFDYVKNGFSGYSSKELLNDTWVKSEYGDPSVLVETPRVLTRIDVKKHVPKDAMALIKGMQMFSFGSILDRFYVAVSTTQFKKETELDLNEALEGTVKTIEAQGAENMIVKSEEFSTEQGIKGIKGYGTLMADNETLSYQILLFSQEGGLQQVIIAYKDGDENAIKIAERMLNSVELKIGN